MNTLIEPAYSQGLTPQEQRISRAYFDRFILELDASEKTKETYTRALRQFVLYLFSIGEMRPTRGNLLAWKRELQLTAHRPTTIQNYITAVKLFFKWTEAEGLYPNIGNGIKGPKLDRQHHNRDALTSSQAGKLLSSIDRSTVKGLRDYSIVCLQVICGLRDIEISRANAEDLRTLGDSPALYVQGKGHQEKDTAVILPPELDEAIRAYLKARGGSNTGALFISTSNNGNGGRLSTRSVSGIAKEALISAGFNSERLTAHSLRHTAVTLALLNGESLEAVKSFARHADIGTTLIYSHSIDEARSTVSNTIASTIFKATAPQGQE